MKSTVSWVSRVVLSTFVTSTLCSLCRSAADHPSAIAGLFRPTASRWRSGIAGRYCRDGPLPTGQRAFLAE